MTDYTSSGYNQFLERVQPLVGTDSLLNQRLTSADIDALFEDGSISTSKLIGDSVTNDKIQTPARSYTSIVSLDNTGNYANIQDALDYVSDQGGGTVMVRNGTYVLTNDIDLPTRVELVGESAGGVILVFAGPYSIRCTGTSDYSTGTVSLSRGSRTITGTGTAWLGNITTSHTFVLDNFPYTIASVDSDTKITLATVYHGPNISNDTYFSAVFNSGNKIKNLVLTTSTTNAVEFSYCDSFLIDLVFVFSVGGDGFNIQHSIRGSIGVIIADGCSENGAYFNNFQMIGAKGMQLLNNSNYGLRANNISQVLMELCPCNNNDIDGMYITNSDRVTMIACEGSRNVRYGIQLDYCENFNIQSGGTDNNGSDGILLNTNCNKNTITSWKSESNTGYGVNIDTASCSNNTVYLNQLTDNTLGKLLDTGTKTISGSNQELTDPKTYIIDYATGSSIHGCGSISEQYWTQTITMQTTLIDTITVKVGTANATSNFIVDLFADDGTGKPTGSTLKSISVAAASLSNNAETSLAFAVTGLTAGTRYVLRFGDANLASDDRYNLYSNDGGTAPTGQKCWKYNGSSWTDVTASIKNVYVKVVSSVPASN